MNMRDFADALASKDVDRYSAWFAEEMHLYTPVHQDPLIGKQVARQVLPVVFSIFQDFEYSDVITGDHTHTLIFRAKVNGIPLDGVDYLRTDEAGYVTEFSVMMRPLAALTALTEAISVQMEARGHRPPDAGHG